MTRARRQPGFTLLELLATMIVTAVIMAVVMPVVITSVSRYADANRERTIAERTAYASDRAVRVLREIPVDASGQAEITTLAADEIVLADGSGLRLTGTDLQLIEPGGSANTLCESVSSFQLLYFEDDGVTATTDLGDLWCVRVAIVSDTVELRAHAFIRERIGGG